MDKNLVGIGIGCVIVAIVMSIIQQKRMKDESQEIEKSMFEVEKIVNDSLQTYTEQHKLVEN